MTECNFLFSPSFATELDEVSHAAVVCCSRCYGQECRAFLLPVAGGPPVCLEAFTLLPQYFWSTHGPLEKPNATLFLQWAYLDLDLFGQLGEAN